VRIACHDTATRAKIGRSQVIFNRRLAKARHTSRSNLMKTVHQAMCLQSRLKQLKLLLIPRACARMVERSQKLLDRMKREDKGKIRVFS